MPKLKLIAVALLTMLSSCGRPQESVVLDAPQTGVPADLRAAPWLVQVESQYRDEADGAVVTVRGRGVIMRSDRYGFQVFTAAHVSQGDQGRLRVQRYDQRSGRLVDVPLGERMVHAPRDIESINVTGAAGSLPAFDGEQFARNAQGPLGFQLVSSTTDRAAAAFLPKVNGWTMPGVTSPYSAADLVTNGRGRARQYYLTSKLDPGMSGSPFIICSRGAAGFAVLQNCRVAGFAVSTSKKRQLSWIEPFDGFVIAAGLNGEIPAEGRSELKWHLSGGSYYRTGVVRMGGVVHGYETLQLDEKDDAPRRSVAELVERTPVGHGERTDVGGNGERTDVGGNGERTDVGDGNGNTSANASPFVALPTLKLAGRLIPFSNGRPQTVYGFLWRSRGGERMVVPASYEHLKNLVSWSDNPLQELDVLGDAIGLGDGVINRHMPENYDLSMRRRMDCFPGAPCIKIEPKHVGNDGIDFDVTYENRTYRYSLRRNQALPAEVQFRCIASCSGAPSLAFSAVELLLDNDETVTQKHQVAWAVVNGRAVMVGVDWE